MSGDPRPLISVCIPTYNRAALLEKALKSILGEFEGAAIEVIVSDNASEDKTEEIVRAYQRQHPNVRYYRNETNIGLDDNAVSCLQRAVGEYVFMFSDDDILLPGSREHLLRVIRGFQPDLLYLNHRGFWETEDYLAVYRRKTSPDKRDMVYTDGFKMLLDRYLVHFTALIYRRVEVLRYLHHLDDYKRGGWERGYAAVVLAHYVVLESPGPFVFVGKCCVAVRNVVPDRSYSYVHSGVIDPARHYQNLRRKNLIGESQLQTLMTRHAMIPTMRLVTAMKCMRDPMLTERELTLIYHLYKRFWLSYLFVFPVLVLPRFVLVLPYYLVSNLKRLYRMITKRSVFE